MSLQHLGKATLRVAKNYTKGYSDVQAKVREATSNDPWGPSGSQMNELAQLTYNQNDFVEIMEMLDKRLNDKGKNWRHVFKALTVLDYCLHAGSENVVIYFKDNIYIIKTLKEFQYIDEYDKDQGANVRQKAKDITNLLQDESRLREARRNRASMRDRMLRGESGADEDFDDENIGRRQPPSNNHFPPPSKRGNREDDELKKAIEASKQSFDKEQNVNSLTSEERNVAAAIRLSEEEEERRRKAADDANAKSLFDDSAPHSTNNPFPLLNFDSNQPMNQPQPQFVQPQFTAYNPYQQQAEQEALQAEWLRQQQLQQQQEQWAHQQQELQAQQLQAQQEEWMRQQFLQQQFLQQQEQQQQQQFPYQQQLQQQQQQQQQNQDWNSPQPTGFGNNNPFALTQTQPDPNRIPTSSSTPTPATTSPTPVVRPPKDDGAHAHLAGLFANRTDDGIDSFGNIGNLRFGHSNTGRIAAQPTGSNPFARQQPQSSEQPFFTI